MKNIFEMHPKLDVVYMTSDGIFFYTANNAQNHARTLKDQIVKTVHRADVMKPKRNTRGSNNTDKGVIKTKTTDPRKDNGKGTKGADVDNKNQGGE